MLLPIKKFYYYMRYTIVIVIDFLSQPLRPNHGLDFGRQRGFLLDGKDPSEKVGCRKESYFLEFKYVDVARDFVGVISMSFLMVPRAPTGTVVVLSSHIRLTSISKSLYLLSFSMVLTEVLVSRGQKTDSIVMSSSSLLLLL